MAPTAVVAADAYGIFDTKLPATVTYPVPLVPPLVLLTTKALLPG